MKNKILVFLTSILFIVPIARADDLPDEWVVAWRDDLSFVKKSLPETHAQLFHSISEPEFNASIDLLGERVPELSHQEIIVELSAIVASINDGHTRLTLPMVEGSDFFAGHSTTPTPKDPSMLFNHYPVRFYIYKDGLFVRKIAAEHSEFAGAKVIRIGRLSADDAMSEVSRVVHRDNELQLRHLMPSRLVIPEVLYALKISDSQNRVDLLLETNDGKQHTVRLLPVARDNPVEWVDSRKPAVEKPIYLRNPKSNFWFEYIAPQKAVYWQFNEVYDKPEESVAQFALRLTDFIANNDVNSLIVDLRFNAGGDNTLNRSLVHALIRSPKLRDPGSLFVITGRGTFSAAMMFAIDLEKQTNAIFVGEPTGAALNHYGDSRKVQLPNSGLTIRVSTLYWQYSGPKDKRSAIEPHLPAVLSSQDYLNGRDPALEMIWAVSNEPSSDDSPIGSWQSRVLGYQTVVDVSAASEGWVADIDFVEMDVSDLPLTSVSFESPVLRFDFPNGDELISFEGRLKDKIIIGKAVMQGQTYPWVARLEQMN